MRYLLDTHVWFWMDEQAENIGAACRAVLENPENALFVASVSTLEFGQLLYSGKLMLRSTLEAWVSHSLHELQLSILDMTHGIAARAYLLPGDFHKDPADRILVSTAIENGLIFITADSRILSYPHVRSMNARQ